MQEFYKIYLQFQSAYAAYREQEAKCEKNYGENDKKQEQRDEIISSLPLCPIFSKIFLDI
ncbi:MAG: hypothetical protein NC180_12315 [Muribaculaceae bacterium]|nr:hypothetical protein [Roseburia sp.]MCM1493986.1 hypothetical protein [Muribaculaceae bacterium]MCM1561047.1 hypothetical protein [Butyrivibrio sp.]